LPDPAQRKHRPRGPGMQQDCGRVPAHEATFTARPRDAASQG
jgi:hypothetical protein